MPLEKQRKNLKIAILVPCYKRPEYTAKCIKALEEAQEYPNTLFVLWDDGSNDVTEKILREAKLPKLLDTAIISEENRGLRQVVTSFFEDPCRCKGWDINFIAKIDNDVLMPKNWLNNMLDIFEKSLAQILSPNYMPSNPAFKFGGEDVNGFGYRPTKNIGGIWVMKADLIKDIWFERHSLWGIKGCINIMRQIFLEKEPIAGWVPGVIAQDLGHWSGEHPEHIKNGQHRQYYAEVGRKIAWN